MPEILQHFLPIPEAARALGIGRSSLYGLLKSGELHAVHVGRRTVISTAELAAFSAKLATAAGVPREALDASAVGVTTTGTEVQG